MAVLQPKQGNITKKLFSKIRRAARKRFLCCLLTMIKNEWVKKKEKEVTDVSYIPRTEEFRKTT